MFTTTHGYNNDHLVRKTRRKKETLHQIQTVKAQPDCIFVRFEQGYLCL